MFNIGSIVEAFCVCLLDDGLECICDDKKIIVPLEQLSWIHGENVFNQFHPQQTIPLLITEYNYQNGYFYGSYRATLPTNPYIELSRFPPNTFFRGIVIQERRDDTVFGDEPVIKLSNGAIGYLDAHSRFTKTNPPISVGLELDVALSFLSISPIDTRLGLCGPWTDSFKEDNRSDTKEILDIGHNVTATLVQKENFGLFYEYRSHRILVEIIRVTWDYKHSGAIMNQFEIGEEHTVRILGYDYTRNIYGGSLFHANRENPYWELTEDKSETIYQGTIYMMPVAHPDSSYSIQLPNGAYGDLGRRNVPESLAKGDKIDVMIKTLQLLTYQYSPLILDTPTQKPAKNRLPPVVKAL